MRVHKRLRQWLILFLLLFVSGAEVIAAPDHLVKANQMVNQETVSAPTIRLTSLDWPPYTGSNLPDGGEITRLVRQVLLEMGYQLQVDFLPWTNAVNQVISGVNNHLAFYPEYPVDDPKLLLSGAIGYSELGLVELVNKPLLLTSFRALANYRFGVVQDYLNMSELDQLITAKVLQPTVNRSDKENILQVARGELDAAVIDNRVLQYLLQHDAQVKAAAVGKVQFSQSLSEHKSLHLVFLATVDNQALVQKFNQQLQLQKNQLLPAVHPLEKP